MDNPCNGGENVEYHVVCLVVMRCHITSAYELRAFKGVREWRHEWWLMREKMLHLMAVMPDICCALIRVPLGACCVSQPNLKDSLTWLSYFDVLGNEFLTEVRPSRIRYRLKRENIWRDEDRCESIASEFPILALS